MEDRLSSEEGLELDQLSMDGRVPSLLSIHQVIRLAGRRIWRLSHVG